jgi:hypothetical protein
MSQKDDEIALVAAHLDVLLDALSANVAALGAILTRTPPPAPGEADERLVAP